MGLQAPTGAEEDMVGAVMVVDTDRRRQVGGEVTVHQAEVDTAQVRTGGEVMVRVQTAGVDTVLVVAMAELE